MLEDAVVITFGLILALLLLMLGTKPDVLSCAAANNMVWAFIP